MTKIASVSIFAVMVLIKIPAFFGFQNRLINLQFINSMCKKATLSIPAIS
jgi:hypothetical protein